MERALIFGAGLALLSGLGALCVHCTAPVVEQDLKARAIEVLTTEGLGFVDVYTDGRDLTLAGIAPGHEPHRRAEELAATVWGVRAVNNNMVVDEQPDTPYTTIVSRAGSVVTLSGSVPSDKYRETLKVAIGKIFEGAQLEDKLQWRPAHHGESWLELLTDTSPLLRGFEPGVVTLSGRTVKVGGEPADLASAYTARVFLEQKLPEGFEGQVDFLDPVPYALLLSRQGRGLLINGHVPDESSRRALVDKALTLFGEGEVEDQLEIRPHDVGEAWLPMVLEAMTLMRRFERGHATLVEQQLALSGVPMDPSASKAAREFLTRVPKPFEARSRIRDIDSYAIEASFDGRSLNLLGSIPDKATREWLVVYARRLFAPATVVDRLVESPRKVDPHWPFVLVEALEALSGFRQGRASLLDYQVSLEGTPRGTDSASTARAFLIYGLPAPFEGQASFKSPEPYETRADFKDGRVILSGNLPALQWRERILQRARLIFGEDKVEDKLKFTGRMEEVIWAVTFEKGLSHLRGFKEGHVLLSDHVLTMKGTASTAAVSASARDYLQVWLARPFKGYAQIDVAVGDSPLQSPPRTIDGPQCQKALGELMEGRTISFESQSCQVVEKSQDLFRDLGEVLMRCPGERVEIGGHTDATGDPVDNLKLSQLRADVVRDYLIALGVPGTRLSARGFGESRPIAGNLTPQGRDLNRRIEFNIVGEQ